MSTSAAQLIRIEPDPAAGGVKVTNAMLRIVLTDGRELSVPLAWFPRLRDATQEQRGHWELIGRGHGIHWPDVDEDVSVRVLLGQAS